MGINGLLPALKPAVRRTHVSAYAGTVVAVDAYSWLHRGSYCCARELCEGRYTAKFVSYCLARADMLRANGCEPYFVFDGARPPLKRDEEAARRHSRHTAAATHSCRAGSRANRIGSAAAGGGGAASGAAISGTDKRRGSARRCELS